MSMSTMRWALFRKAKRWWGASVGMDLLAIVSVLPGALWLATPPWATPAIAVALAVTARSILWRSETIREYAERLLGEEELHVGLGRKRDPVLVADVEAGFGRLPHPMGRKGPPRHEPYFSVTGAPSGRRLVMQMWESSWWTEQSGKTMRTLLLVTAIPIFATTAILILVAEPVTIRIYGFAVWASVFTSTFHIVWRYHKLATGCRSAFQYLDELRRRDSVTVADALIPTGSYQHTRRVGPPIPEWLWRIRRGRLESAWAGLAEDGKGSPETDESGC